MRIVCAKCGKLEKMGTKKPAKCPRCGADDPFIPAEEPKPAYKLSHNDKRFLRGLKIKPDE